MIRAFAVGHTTPVPRDCELVEPATGGRELGRRRIAIERRSRRTLRVPLNAAGRRFAARGGRLTVAVVAKGGTARYTVAVPAAR